MNSISQVNANFDKNSLAIDPGHLTKGQQLSKQNQMSKKADTCIFLCNKLEYKQLNILI